MKQVNYVIFLALALTAFTIGVQGQAAATGDIDSEAMSALNRMGAYLRTLNAFQVRAFDCE